MKKADFAPIIIAALIVTFLLLAIDTCTGQDTIRIKSDTTPVEIRLERWTRAQWLNYCDSIERRAFFNGYSVGVADRGRPNVRKRWKAYKKNKQ